MDIVMDFKLKFIKNIIGTHMPIMLFLLWIFYIPQKLYQILKFIDYFLFYEIVAKNMWLLL